LTGFRRPTNHDICNGENHAKGNFNLSQPGDKNPGGNFSSDFPRARRVWGKSSARSLLTQFIIPAIADGLGFTFSGPAEPKVQLLNYLRAKQILLVLDNFEHLLAGVDLLGDLLQQTQGGQTAGDLARASASAGRVGVGGAGFAGWQNSRSPLQFEQVLGLTG
jgi:hypothetical protein